MDQVFLHPFAGVLSAYGMGLADQTVLREQAIEQPFTAAVLPHLEEVVGRLARETAASLAGQGADPFAVHTTRLLHLRYQGTEAALPVPMAPLTDAVQAFTEAHRTRFGFTIPERPLMVEAVVVEATAPGEAVTEAALAVREGPAPIPLATVEIWSGGASHPCPVFDRAALRAGDRIPGPALIRESIGTIVVEPGWTVQATVLNHLMLRRTTARPAAVAAGTNGVDPVLLKLFNNLFMHVAEQTGLVLQNVSQSVNIKERLDFSCAIFDAQGRLVANAPHVPVHLSAMGESVRTVLQQRGATLRPGDVVALNNPFNGGTHLPDVTVITPVFDEAGQDTRRASPLQITKWHPST